MSTVAFAGEAGAARRAYRLLPWVVRLLVPPTMTGTYVLFRAGAPAYTGRSDTDLQRRLVEHARSARGDYFDFDAHGHRRAAFLTECATFHAFDGLDNRIHPAAPAGSAERCPFCHHISAATIKERLRPEQPLQEPPRWRPLSNRG